MADLAPDSTQAYRDSSRNTGYLRLPDGVEIFTEGDELYDAMLKDIQSAQHAIRCETYIFEEAEVGERFLQAFRDKAEQGVHVILRIDSAGTMFSLSNRAVKRLRESGVQFAWCHRWSWRDPLSFGHRNHRKLLIVDREAAYLGGFNIHNASSRRHSGDLAWRDTHVKLSKSEVHQAVAAFDSYGSKGREPAIDETNSYYLVATREHGRRDVMRKLFGRQFRRAKSRIWVTTPYFVPDRNTQKFLCKAASNGVDVRLLTSAKNDVPITQWAARAAYTQLLAAGVRVYEYQPRLHHAKTVVVDRDWSTIGTANLDYRSLFVNDEINLASRYEPMNAALARIFLEDLSESREVLDTPWKNRGVRTRVAEFIGWLGRRWL